MVCLDTSVLIDYLLGDKNVIKLVESHIESGDGVCTTAITEYELNKHHDKLKRELAKGLLDTLHVYYFDRNSAIEASKVFQSLSDAGKMINENDILIAGIAIANNQLLVTRDKRFNDISGYGKILVF